MCYPGCTPLLSLSLYLFLRCAWCAVTPTLLAGDRSLVSVIAHEIAHSWTGNLITNATWEHFWLNEGMAPESLQHAEPGSVQSHMQYSPAQPDTLNLSKEPICCMS